MSIQIFPFRNIIAEHLSKVLGSRNIRLSTRVLITFFLACPNLHLLSQSDFLNVTATGRVGIGITDPLAPLHLYNPVSSTESMRIQGKNTWLSFYDGVNYDGFLWNSYGNMSLGTSYLNSAGKLIFYTYGQPRMNITSGGLVGIGTTNPVSKLTIQAPTNAYGFTHTDGIVTLGSWIGSSAGTPGGWIGTKSNHPLNFFTADLPAQMTLLPNGNFGIGTANPSNKLQIGSLGNTGFNSNDFAVGNGINALGIYQSNTATTIASTTDIILNPRNNGQGRVGINTNTPRAPLDVVDEISVSAAPGSGFYSYLNFASFTNGIGAVTTPPLSLVPSVSIIASGRVYATEFDAYSDARIKNIVGNSSTAKDLETIKALQITDYTMRDKVKYGDRPYKKIIAQEVEKVYPQVVSKHTDFIPNVYQATSKMEKAANGYLLHFTNNHNITSSAKKIRMLLSETERMEEVNIVSIPSANEVVINVMDIKGDKVFVYGEEVDDFRTVDYEGLTTLNISATQELCKIIAKQQTQIDEQNLKIMELIQSIQWLSHRESGASTDR